MEAAAVSDVLRTDDLSMVSLMLSIASLAFDGIDLTAVWGCASFFDPALPEERMSMTSF